MLCLKSKHWFTHEKECSAGNLCGLNESCGLAFSNPEPFIPSWCVRTWFLNPQHPGPSEAWETLITWATSNAMFSPTTHTHTDSFLPNGRSGSFQPHGYIECHQVLANIHLLLLQSKLGSQNQKLCKLWCSWWTVLNLGSHQTYRLTLRFI